MAIEKLIEARKQVKKRKPTFKRVQSHQFAKLSEEKWRRPKGKGNKVRRMRKGKPSRPTVGLKAPSLVKGFNKQGMKEVIVYNVTDLDLIKEKHEVATLGSNVGGRKKLEILNKAKEMKVSFSNVKDIDVAIKSLTKEKKDEKKKTKKVLEPSKKDEKTSEDKSSKDESKEDKKGVEK